MANMRRNIWKLNLFLLLSVLLINNSKDEYIVKTLIILPYFGFSYSKIVIHANLIESRLKIMRKLRCLEFLF